MDAINLGLFGIRLILGVVMLAHGINHVFRGGKIPGTARWFESLGMRPGVLHAWLASLTEIGAGAMLVLGLLTPLAAGGVVGVMLVALITNHLKNGFFIFRPGEGYEYVLTLLVVALCLAPLGAGEWSVDHALELTWTAGWSGLLWAAIPGLGGGAALLAVFWRPKKA
ncbi:MAG: DoxX family protein [Acidimicrobiales bacterium]|jgi:putative oxidoreductase|nr:DoxX family protein [Acidimicrobiales bacterium]